MNDPTVIVETKPVEQAEIDEAFHSVADARWASIVATGKTVSWDDAKAWLEARSRGERPPKPYHIDLALGLGAVDQRRRTAYDD